MAEAAEMDSGLPRAGSNSVGRCGGCRAERFLNPGAAQDESCFYPCKLYWNVDDSYTLTSKHAGTRLLVEILSTLQ